MQNQNGDITPPEVSEKPAPAVDAEQPGCHKRRCVGASLLLLAVLGGGAFALWQQQNTLREETRALAADNTRLQSTLNTLQNDIGTTRATLETQFSTLTQEMHETLQQQRVDTNDWRLPKARYFLELARINATWGNTPQTTIALLQQSDALLTAVNTPAIVSVRKAIAGEILAIKAAPTVDTTGMLSQLDAARKALATLKLDDSLVAKDVETAPSENTNPESRTWRTRLQESVGLLEKLVVVRRQTDGVVALPTPLQEAVLREGVRLNLEEAQWALLRANPDVWQFALNQAVENINRHFDTEDSATKALLQSLQTLKSTPLTATAPIPAQALELLNTAMQAAQNGSSAP